MDTNRPFFHELRYLLHANKEHYDSDANLYVTSQKNSVWEKVANKVLDPWRIIPQVLAKEISPMLREELKIQEILPEGLIEELSPDSITGDDLSSIEEREELLREIANNQTRKELWRSLALHETVNNEKQLVSIDESTYLENPEFPLDSSLNSIVALIRRNNNIRQDWIELWTPQAALSIILEQDRPEQFAAILLELVPKANEELLLKLRKTPWLPLQNGKAVAPENVVLLPSHLSDKLEKDLKNLFRAEESSYVSLSMLAIKPSQYPEALKKDSTWYENNILKFLLDQNIKHPSKYCAFILKTLATLLQRKQPVSKKNIERLKQKEWLLDRRERTISPQKVVIFADLNKEFSAILEQIDVWDYVTPEMLIEDIDISFCVRDKELSKIFIKGDDALEALGITLSCTEEYYIGKFPLAKIEAEFDKFTEVLASCEHLPVLSLTTKVSTEKYQKYILPEVLRPIGDSNRLIKILNWIAENYSKPSQEQISVYNQYLQLACKSSDFSQNILPHIQLMNQCKEWKSPSELCDGDRYTGIDRSSLLDINQRKLLSSYLNNCLESDSYVNTEDSIDPAPNNIDTSDDAQKLEQYFRPWLPYVMPEAIGCFLCVIAGENKKTEKLAQSYLQKRKFGDVKERLLWGTTIRKREFQIYIQSSNDKRVSVINLLEEQINVEKLSQKIPDHLFVGELSSRATKLTLVSIKPVRSISHSLENILKESIKIFNEIITGTNEEPFEDIWEDITTSKQLDIQVAKRLMLEQCSLLLRRLGVENYQVKDILKQLDTNDHQRVSLKSRSPNIYRKNQKIQDNEEEKEKIILKLEQLIEEDQNIQQDIIAAVRRKIGQGQSGYQSTNIPFELFQNADDCLAEFRVFLCLSRPYKNHFC